MRVFILVLLLLSLPLLIGVHKYMDAARSLEADAEGGEMYTVPDVPNEMDENHALLEIYMSAIYRDPYAKVEHYESKHQFDYELRRTEWVEEIYNLSQSGTREDMIHWFLQYEEELETMFLPALPVGTILYAGRNFTIPQLTHQYYTYMPVRAITNRTSHQWKFIPHLGVDELGFMRYGDAYAVALASYYGITIGGIYEIKFQNGEVIYAVLGDCKKDSETDPTNRFHPTPGSGVTSGNIVEFIIDDSGWNHLSTTDRVAPINQMVRERFPTPVTHITFVGVSEHAVIR